MGGYVMVLYWWRRDSGLACVTTAFERSVVGPCFATLPQLFFRAPCLHVLLVPMCNYPGLEHTFAQDKIKNVVQYVRILR